jgi:hypothetical protein
MRSRLSSENFGERRLGTKPRLAIRSRMSGVAIRSRYANASRADRADTRRNPSRAFGTPDMMHMTDRKPHRLARFEDFAMTGDGTKYAFKVITVDGLGLDLEIEASEIGTLVQYLVSQAGALGRQSILDGVERNPFADSLAPIPLEGIGMSTSTSPETMLLVVRLYTFELAFEIPSTKLEWFAQNIRNTGSLMSSANQKPN